MTEKLKNLNWKDIGIRALKTFIQTFLGYLTIDSLLGITDLSTLKTVAVSTAISAATGAICAVWNMLLGIVSDTLDELEIESEV